jgi:hypothetical protein
MALELFPPAESFTEAGDCPSAQGIVTRTDLRIDAPAQPKVTQREDGSYLIDGFVPFPDVMRSSG